MLYVIFIDARFLTYVIFAIVPEILTLDLHNVIYAFFYSYPFLLSFRRWSLTSF